MPGSIPDNGLLDSPLGLNAGLLLDDAAEGKFSISKAEHARIDQLETRVLNLQQVCEYVSMSWCVCNNLACMYIENDYHLWDASRRCSTLVCV